MSVDWKTLSNKTAGLRTLQTVYERNNTDVNRVLFAGLYVKLSEIAALLTPAGAATISIFADTVVADVTSLPARGLVVIAREIDAGALGGAPLRLGLAGKDSMAQFLAESVTGGPITVAGGSGRAMVPYGSRPFAPVLYRVSAAGALTASVQGQQGDLEDLFGRIWALNSMKAGFAAAAHLMTLSGKSDRELARSILHWIVRAIGALGSSASSDYRELYGKAAALLVELNIAPGAYYLPILSADFYQKQVKTFLGALKGYETNFARLDAKSDLAKVVEEVGTALKAVSGGEVEPLQARLANVERSVASLKRDIQALSAQVILQQIDSDARFTVMVATIKSEKIQQFVVAVFKVIVDVLKAGIAFTKEEKSIGDGLSALKDAVLDGKAAYDAITAEMPDNKLVKRSGELLDMQHRLMLAYAASQTLFEDKEGQGGPALPEGLAIEAVDPNLAWNNYVVAAETEMTILKEALGSDSSSLEAVNRYLATLLVLANYGRAIDSKFVACATQMAAVPMIRSQIKAAQNAEARWAELSAKAQTDEERLAILKSVVQARIDTIKRAIFAAWRDFRNSFFYLYFQEPSLSINLDMDSAQMQVVFGKLTEDIAAIYVDPDAGEKVALPSDDVPLEFDFTVLRSGQPEPAEGGVALFTPAGAGSKARLTWTFAQGSDQLRYKLPNADEIAVWVKQAQFFFDGMLPNREGNAMMEVSTSGAYQNGYGAARSYCFVSRGLRGDYAYKVKEQSVYNSWKINTEVYATPTPFTQWQILFDPNGGDPSQVTKLRVRLTLAYRRQQLSAAQ
jgi:hypothetical protein